VLLTRDGRWVSAHQTAESLRLSLSQVLTLPSGINSRPFTPVRAVLWDLSRDGTQALETALTQPRGVNLQTLQSEDPEPLLQHPAFNLYVPYFSPDDRWIIVTAENGLDPPHLFAVPFRPPYPIPVRNWVDLGEGIFGQWAPAGDRVYFVRDHEGSRCIFTLTLDPVTKRPISEAIPIQHFHSAWRSPLQLEPGFFRLMVAPDKLIFTLGETQSNLWLAEP